MSYQTGFGATSDTPSPGLFGVDASTWLLLILGGAVGLYLLDSGRGRRGTRRRYDELGNEIGPNDDLWRVSYVSPDKEYIITNEIAAPNKRQALALMKQWAKEEGEPMRGAEWDVEDDPVT